MSHNENSGDPRRTLRLFGADVDPTKVDGVMYIPPEHQLASPPISSTSDDVATAFDDAPDTQVPAPAPFGGQPDDPEDAQFAQTFAQALAEAEAASRIEIAPPSPIEPKQPDMVPAGQAQATLAQFLQIPINGPPEPIQPYPPASDTQGVPMVEGGPDALAPTEPTPVPPVVATTPSVPPPVPKDAGLKIIKINQLVVTDAQASNYQPVRPAGLEPIVLPGCTGHEQRAVRPPALRIPDAESFLGQGGMSSGGYPAVGDDANGNDQKPRSHKLRWLAIAAAAVMLVIGGFVIVSNFDDEPSLSEDIEGCAREQIKLAGKTKDGDNQVSVLEAVRRCTEVYKKYEDHGDDKK